MRVLFCDKAFERARGALSGLLTDDEVIYCPKAEIADHIHNVDVAIPLMSRLDGELIGKGKQLRLIQQYGVGLEGVDLGAAQELGIPVANIPSHKTGNSVAVAEWTLWLMMSLARNLPEIHQALQNQVLGAPTGLTLFGKKAGIVGLGNLGRAIAKVLKALGMEVWAIKGNPAAGDPMSGVLDYLGGPADLERLLDEVDFLIMAVTLGPETIGLMGREEMTRMKPEAYLINVSRGGVVDYDSLLWALEQGQIAGAGLDVFWTEPIDPDDPIFQYNVIASPHIAGVTDYSFNLMAEAAAGNINRLRKGEPLENTAF